VAVRVAGDDDHRGVIADLDGKDRAWCAVALHPAVKDLLQLRDGG
jgi:hypothetical protein